MSNGKKGGGQFKKDSHLRKENRGFCCWAMALTREEKTMKKIISILITVLLIFPSQILFALAPIGSNVSGTLERISADLTKDDDIPEPAVLLY